MRRTGLLYGSFCPIASLVLVAHLSSGPARSFEPATPRRAVQILEFVSHDYRKAAVTREADEIAEQVENLEHAADEVARLPSNPGRQPILDHIRQIQQLVKALTPPPIVSHQLVAVERQIGAAYPAQLAPPGAISTSEGVRLYRQACASCHGADGRSNTPAARLLKPRPPRLDRARLGPLTPAYLFDTITHGVVGTAMPSYGSVLSVQDRWNIVFRAFQVAGVTKKHTLTGR